MFRNFHFLISITKRTRKNHQLGMMSIDWIIEFLEIPDRKYKTLKFGLLPIAPHSRCHRRNPAPTACGRADVHWSYAIQWLRQPQWYTWRQFSGCQISSSPSNSSRHMAQLSGGPASEVQESGHGQEELPYKRSGDGARFGYGSRRAREVRNAWAKKAQ